jgi:hypothetical protein
MDTVHSKITNWFIHLLQKEQPIKETYPLSDFDRIRYEVRSGDVLLVEGTSRVGNVVRTITQSTWSHAAMYIGRIHDIEDPEFRKKIMQFSDFSPETQLLVESLLGHGTVVTPLDYYQKQHIRICRPRGISRIDAQKVLNFSISQLGKPYNVRQIFDLMRLLLPWRLLPRRWHSSLFISKDASDVAKNVCSTMLVEAFQSVNFPVLPVIEEKDNRFTLKKSNPFLAIPKDFDTSPYFEIIKYPFISFERQGRYHYLPWSEETLSEKVVSEDLQKKEEAALYVDENRGVFKDRSKEKE